MRVGIIGGGVAGLTAAHELRRQLGEAVSITVFDQADRVGGKLRTVQLAGRSVDVGAEAFVSRRPEAFELVTELGLTAELVHPASGVAPAVHAGGRTVGLPPRTFLGVPAEPAKLSAVLSPEGAALAAAEAGLPPVEWGDGDASVGRLLSERFGPEVVQRLVEPLLGGVYAGRADDLGVRATMTPLADALDRGATSLTAAATVAVGPPPAPGTTRPPVFGTLRGGLGGLTDALAAHSGAEIRGRTTVRALHRTPSGWRVETGPVPSPEFFEFDALVVAVPSPAARKLFEPIAPVAAAAFARIDVASMAVISLALPPGTELPRTSGNLIALGERHADGTPFTAKAFTYSSRKWSHLAGEEVLLRASVGRYGEVETLQRDDSELVTAVLADLAELSAVTAKPVDVVVQRWGGGLPQYGVGHLSAVAEIRRAVAELPGLAVAGATLAGVGVPACVLTGRQAATRVVEHLRAGATMDAWRA
ncbi:protoporphyrinogen oxidase [Allokutzneria albata]|uniref:Coproporphyrinogen III oxidase n=1 Tax=Allokutzneria albata TaxID=211114 RepID=A0A1G9WRV8_ALLAB|nr:protoporphyrinogen oxidase [Allokutzneria albata]SDM87312.1 oxygen-dependent protoporphyrinogen oxidase [Allokutzneria albata]